MNSRVKNLQRRPWWMVNGARENWGDLWTDRIDHEWFRWKATEIKNDDEGHQEKVTET